MNFLSPITALIAAGITVPLLVLLYFLKLRRRRLDVSSTLLWKRAIHDLEVNSPFQKLRKNLLLLLQLILLAALLLAVARPAMDATANPGDRVVILIDHSASMNAADVSPSRLAEAKRMALEQIDHLYVTGDGRSSSGVMVVSFASRATVLQPFTTDLSLLRRAIRGIEPTDQFSNLGDALKLIEPFALEAQNGGGSPNRLVVYVISDGRVHLDMDNLPAVPASMLKYVTVNAEDSPADNIGIVSLSARRDVDKPHIVQVFTRVAHYGDSPRRVNLSLAIDGRLSRVQPVDLSAAGDEPAIQSLQFDFVLPGSVLIELSHDAADDLPADDTARLVLAPARQLRVLLVSSGNVFLERVIRSVGLRDLVMMTPEKFENQSPESLSRGEWDPTGLVGGAGSGFDVIVFDDYSPSTVPPVSSIYLGAAPPIDGLAIHKAEDSDDAGQLFFDWRRDHPVLRYVVLDDVVLAGPGRLVLPPQAEILATGQSGPLIAEMVHESRRHVVTSFNILNSNWPLYVSFPVFMSNSLQVLGLGGLVDEAGIDYRPGDVVMVPVDGGEARLEYTGPVPLEAEVRSGRAVLPVFPRAGIYETADTVSALYKRFAVNLLDQTESDLRPVTDLPTGSGTVTGQSNRIAVRREVWHWFIWAAMGLLMLEWLIYTRRMHL